jgi:hypothetical protein
MAYQPQRTTYPAAGRWSSGHQSELTALAPFLPRVKPPVESGNYGAHVGRFLTYEYGMVVGVTTTVHSTLDYYVLRTPTEQNSVRFLRHLSSRKKVFGIIRSMVMM